MTREEAKELLPVIQAFADGKDVETKTGSGWMSIENMSFAGKPDSYRIKPDPKYRPFKDAEECWQEMLKHQPFGWIKGKEDEYHTFITVVDNNDEMSLSGNGGWSFIGIMKYYTFADGTPFGMKEED